MRRPLSYRSPFSVSERRIRRPVAALLAFLLAIAFSPMLLAAGPASAAADFGTADRALTMDVNGLSSPDEAFVLLGGTLRYKLVATNNGPDTEPNAIVQGQIVPWPATFDRFETTTGTYVDVSGFGTWTIGALAPGESVTLFVYATATTQATNQVATATVDPGTTGSTIVNHAETTETDQDDPNPDNNTDTAAVTVAEPANSPPSPVVPDDDGNLVPADSVSDSIAVGETPKALDIVDPEGDAFTVVIQTGTLPVGVSMNDQGVFSGTATETGTFVLTMETCDDRTPQACSTFTYTLPVDEELPNAGIETTQIAIAGLAALFLGALMLVATSRRRDEDGQSVAR